MKGAVEKLLRAHMAQAEAARVASMLSTGTWTHDHPRTADIARLLGLPVVQGLDPGIYRLMRLFPQPVQQQSAVEYLPGRREPEPQQGHRPKS